MSINLSSLTKYTDQISNQLINSFTLTGRTAALMTPHPGVKYKQSLNIMNSSLAVVAGGSCGWNPQGTIALSQRDIQVCDFKIEESICLAEFEDYWTGQYMKSVGSYNESIPIEIDKIFTADKVAKIASTIDTYFWRGSTTGDDFIGGTASPYTLCDGLLQIMDHTGSSASKVIPAGASASFTSANILANVRAAITAIPEDILAQDDLTMFVNYATFNMITFALIDQNNYHYTAVDAANDYTMIFPGSNVKIVATKGMVNNRYFLTTTQNLHHAFDLQSDSESFRVWFDLNTDEVRFRAKWKSGVQIGFPQYVVSNK